MMRKIVYEASQDRTGQVRTGLKLEHDAAGSDRTTPAPGCYRTEAISSNPGNQRQAAFMSPVHTLASRFFFYAASASPLQRKCSSPRHIFPYLRFTPVIHHMGRTREREKLVLFPPSSQGGARSADGGLRCLVLRQRYCVWCRVYGRRGDRSALLISLTFLCYLRAAPSPYITSHGDQHDKCCMLRVY
ncbi:hypothetical protein J6590_043331 [Homalodisca vitripennis]|nr:hypothetical protein J6590_043331 [Homalodisca vitripennis]